VSRAPRVCAPPRSKTQTRRRSCPLRSTTMSRWI
jgi:hypothetical protein